MDHLRVLLFSGLLLHKMVWEVLKRRGPASAPWSEAPGLVKQSIRFGKLLALALLVLQTLFLRVLPISEKSSRLRMIGTAIYLVGLSSAILGRIQLGRNWVDIEEGQVLAKQDLVSEGIYGYIRHPIYAGDMLLLLGLELALNSWLVLLMVVPIAIFVKQALSEEGILAAAFANYDEYAKRTKRFIPFVI